MKKMEIIHKKPGLFIDYVKNNHKVTVMYGVGTIQLHKDGSQDRIAFLKFIFIFVL